MMEIKKHKIFVIDDDEGIVYALKQLFLKDGYSVASASDAISGMNALRDEDPTLVFMDINMPGMNGLESLKEIKKENPGLPVIMVTGYGTVETAVRAMQFGAFDYLTKPLDIQQVRKVTSEAIARLENINRSHDSLTPIKAEFTDKYELIGKSPQMQNIFKLVGSVSTTPNLTPVLLLGESGTGKELVARAIHSYGTNADQPFVAVNCTAVPETLLESELFGYEKGAFTGASERKLGKFEVAKHGTIFLDEIGDLSQMLQQKLLRVLQERQFERLGSNDVLEVGARFIAATNKNIDQEVNKGNFRKDLFYRLNVMVINIPPLRERQEDVPILADYFLAKYSERFRKKVSGFTDDAMRLLTNYTFAGNVRELENIVERAVILVKQDVITSAALGELTRSPQDGEVRNDNGHFADARKRAIDNFERLFVLGSLQKHSGNIVAAARASGMTRQNFQRLVSKHGINADDFRKKP
jgi:DNA-binding NtrC family response regulator